MFSFLCSFPLLTLDVGLMLKTGRRGALDFSLGSYSVTQSCSSRLLLTTHSSLGISESLLSLCKSNQGLLNDSQILWQILKIQNISREAVTFRSSEDFWVYFPPLCHPLMCTNEVSGFIEMFCLQIRGRSSLSYSEDEETPKCYSF